MSTATALTMEELELEQAELLPSRETLGCYNPCRCYCPPPPCFSVHISICVGVGI
jgi:hypothetical protein